MSHIVVVTIFIIRLGNKDLMDGWPAINDIDPFQLLYWAVKVNEWVKVIFNQHVIGHLKSIDIDNQTKGLN